MVGWKSFWGSESNLRIFEVFLDLLDARKSSLVCFLNIKNVFELLEAILDF